MHNFFTLSGSLLEGYKSGKLGLRFTIYPSDKRTNFSALFRFGESGELGSPIDNSGRKILGGHTSNGSDQEMPVLVHVGEFVQHVKIMGAEIVDSAGLQIANQFASIRNYPSKTTVLDCFFEPPISSANGKGLDRKSVV